MNNNDNSYNDEQSEQSLPCTSIGPFKLVKFLGSGAFAKVYLAKHETTNEEVAIKYIKKQELFINEMSSPEALSNEINNHKMLFHNNIARIYCTIETNTTISIVTEYCSNGDLISKVIEQGKFDEVTACNIFAQIINGLEYMHNEYGLAHRDMKPENVLFDHLNEVKLCDFGLSKFYTDENNQMQLLTTPCGSPIYAAPEMLMNKPYNGNLIDIWSAGITLYVMVAGKLPFDDENIQSLIHKITKGVFDMPSDLSSSCKDIISKLLTVDPSKRITFAEIKRHAWFNSNSNSNSVFNVRGLSIKDVLIPVDDDVVIELVEEGFSSVDSIVRSIIMNNHDELTVGYYLRVKKKIREGGKSVSDLANKDGLFMEYVMREDSKWEYYDWEEDEVVGKIMERIHKKMVIEENKRAEFMDVPDFSGGKMERENDIVVNVDVLDEEINEDVHNISKCSEHNNNNNNNADKENHNDNNIKDTMTGEEHLQPSNKETISTNNNINETITQIEQKPQLVTECKTESKKTKNTKQPKDSQFLSKKKQPPTSTKPSKSKPLSKKKELTISTHPPSFKDKQPKQTTTTTSKNMTISSYRDKPSINNHKHILTKPTKTLPNSQSTTNLSHLKTRLTNTISSSHQKQPKVNKIPNIKNSLLTKTSKQQRPTTSKGRNINLTINTNNNSTRVSGALPAHQKISSTSRVSTETKQTNAITVVQTTQPKQNESSFAKFKKIAINTNKDKARHVNNAYNKNIRLKQRTKENENSINSNRNNTNTNEHSISDISSSIIRNKHIKKINILNTSVIKAHNNSSRLDSSTMNAVNTNNKHNSSSNNNSKRHSVKSSNPESLKRKIVPKTARHVQYRNTINHQEKSKTKTSGVMSHSFSQKTLCNTFKNNNEHNLSIVQEVPQLIRNKKKTQSNISNVIVTKKDIGSVQKELTVLFGSQNVEMNKDKKCFMCKNINNNGSKISFVLEVEEVVKNKNKNLKLTAVVNEGGDVNLGKIVMKIKKKLTS